MLREIPVNSDVAFSQRPFQLANFLESPYIKLNGFPNDSNSELLSIRSRIEIPGCLP